MTITFKINGVPHTAEGGTLIIEACQQAGYAIPRYCYHPALTVVGSCRMCLVEIEGSPRLVPSCQTHVSKDVNILTDSPKVLANRRSVMEYLLINHPLDCPVCDQAGECYLQDYSFNHGSPLTRFAETKIKQPKKDLGPHIMLYMDRCVLCSRCVRFTREIAGTGELLITGRGSKCEIDIFPGRPLANKLSGCVADICPVGALLDKHFLHQQRVWRLQHTPSVCPRCSAGCNININHNLGQIWRLKPRANRHVNGFWMCDEGRYGWDHVGDPLRVAFRPRARQSPGMAIPGLGTQGATSDESWTELSPTAFAERLSERLRQVVHEHGPGSIAGVLSPMWTTEEQFMLARVLRSIDEQAVLAIGPAPVVGQDETFKAGFTIRAEKCPNRRGAERVLAALGGPVATFDELLDARACGMAAKPGDADSSPRSQIHALWLNGDYPDPVWIADNFSRSSADTFIIASDLFDSPALAAAEMQWPGISWAEREGTFVNVDGRVQQLLAAPVGPENSQPIALLLWLMLGGTTRRAEPRGGPVPFERPYPVDLPEVWRQMAEAGVEGYPPHPPADLLPTPAPFAGNYSSPGIKD